MSRPMTSASSDFTWSLSDPQLLRTQAYINGAWVDADSGATFDVTNPATQTGRCHGCQRRGRRDTARHRGRSRGATGVGRAIGDGSRGDPATLE